MASKVPTGSRSDRDGLLGRVLENLKQFVPPADVEARRAGLKSGTRVMESLLAAGFDEESVLLACCSALSLPPVPDAWLTEPPVWPRELDVSVCLRLGVVPIGLSTEPLRLGFANVELAAKREIQELPPHKRYLMLGRNQPGFFNAGGDVSGDAIVETEEKTSLTANLDFDSPTVTAVVPLPDEVASAARLSSSAADGEDDLLFTDLSAGGDESENDPTVQETTVPVPAARAPPPTEPTAPMRARLIGEVPLSTRKRSRTLVSPENQTTLKDSLEACDSDDIMDAVDDPTPAAVVEVKPPVRPPMSTGEFHRVPKSGRFREVARTNPGLDELASLTSDAFQSIEATLAESDGPVGMPLRGATPKVMASLDPPLPPARVDSAPARPPRGRTRSIDPLDPSLAAAGETPAQRARMVAPLDSPSTDRPRGARPFVMEQGHRRSVGIFVAGAVSVLLLSRLSCDDTQPAQSSPSVTPGVASSIPVAAPRSSPPPTENRGLDLVSRQRSHIEKASREKDDQKALIELSIAIRLDPRTIEARDALLARARRYVALGQRARAEEDVLRLLKRTDVTDIREAVEQLSRTTGR
jgi:hypothetical protein